MATWVRCPVCRTSFKKKGGQVCCSRRCAAKQVSTHVELRCQCCGGVFKAARRHSRQKYCSWGCYSLARRKVKWPTEEQLRHLLKKATIRKIAESYGLTQTAVWHWCDFYGIEKPLRSRKKPPRTVVAQFWVPKREWVMEKYPEMFEETE